MTSRIVSLVIVSVMLLHAGSLAQIRTDLLNGLQHQERQSGSLRMDLFHHESSTGSGGFMLDKDGPLMRQKSPLRAALYSAVIPGAGQFYTESYTSALAFGIAEIGLWVVYAIYDAKGDQQTSDFESFADRNWSVVKYAEWVERYGAMLNPEAVILQGTVISQDPTRSPWDRVDWAKLNRNEEAIGRKTGTGFSHRLPRRPEQQYFEVIGKYEQYTSGWSDSNVGTSDYLTNVSPQFRSYRDMRGRANDLYMVAGTAAGVLVANHLISTLHAAWSAHRYNTQIRLESHLESFERPFGMREIVPTATLSIQF